MAGLNNLPSRIDAEFSAAEKQIKDFPTQEVREYHGRLERLEKSLKVCDELRDAWRPRLEALSKKLADKAEVTPVITPTRHEATFTLNSKLAQITLGLAVTTDFEVRNLVLDYNLDILPILMKFEPHARLEMPLDAIDATVIGSWIDDRLIDFVKTYLALHEEARSEFATKHRLSVSTGRVRLRPIGRHSCATIAHGVAAMPHQISN